MSSLQALLRPYQPSSDDPFDAVKAAHLLNRTGFGGAPEEIDHVLKLGPMDAVDWLLDFPDAGAEEQEQGDLPDLSSIDGYPKTFREIQTKLRDLTPEDKKKYRQEIGRANAEAVRELSSWWLRRMAYGAHPLQEKLTLFWHGHFTTSAKDERAALLMWNQNELLRRQSAGNYRDFVRQISRDPAMLDYLNNQQNRKQHANENYARELMELFTLGIGHYTEDDVKQGARAFTGWGHDGEEFVFRKNQHDEGEKVFLGHRGNFDGDDVLDIILQQPACPKFIARELFAWFAYDEVEEPIVESLGAQLRQNRWELRPLIRTILTSRAFYSDQAMGTQIKCPIQLVMGTIRLLELPMPQGRILEGALNQMGQVPLMPPNVRGWPGGRLWINTSTLFIRYNTAVFLAGGGGRVPEVYGKNLKRPKIRMVAADVDFDPRPGGDDVEEVVAYWVSRLIQRPIDDEKRKVLADALDHKPQNPQFVRKMVQLIVSMPEYQLC